MMALSAAELRQRAESDPALAEDIRSLNESAPYVIRLGDASGPMDCERCGTPVAAVPEALIREPHGARRWQRAIWEPEAGRRHALRRCEAMQGRPPREPGS